MAGKQTHHQSTKDNEEIYRFNQVAREWWDAKGPFKPLHQMTPCRLRFIRDALQDVQFNKNAKLSTEAPFEKLKVLDIGCGGGLVSEPFARLGATVTGIDASERAIKVAKSHAQLQNLPIRYLCQTPEQAVLEKQKYEVVLALEVLEHVPDPAQFVEICARLLKKGGVFIFSTLNRTWRSYAFAIAGAEYLLRIVPQGTHDWHKFLKPHEVESALRAHSLQLQTLKGMQYRPLSARWSLSANLSVNYIGAAVKGAI